MRINNKQYNFKGGLKRLFNKYDVCRNDNIELNGVEYKITDFWNLNKNYINKYLNLNGKDIIWIHEVTEKGTNNKVFLGRAFGGYGHYIIPKKVIEKLGLEPNKNIFKK